jgi:FkbM family methyltransferase
MTTIPPDGPLLAYDLGMRNGDDSRYLLDKGYRVVGVDANPWDCAGCAGRFAAEIADGRMQVINVGVGPAEEVLPFHINLREPELSTFAPQPGNGDPWEIRLTPVRRLSSLIEECGPAHFVKIDVEHFDHLVLHDLYDKQILPPYISAEAHEIDVYCALVFMGYRAFKLVEGNTVAVKYGELPIERLDGARTTYRFAPLSSGPFGEDIPGAWMDKNALLAALLNVGLGWIDIHAKR